MLQVTYPVLTSYYPGQQRMPQSQKIDIFPTMCLGRHRNLYMPMHVACGTLFAPLTYKLPVFKKFWKHVAELIEVELMRNMRSRRR